MNNNSNQNKSKSKVAAFFAGKGFYIVLILCVAAIGVSGYYILRSNVTGKIEDTATLAVESIPSAEVSVMFDEEAGEILDNDSVPVMAIPSVSDEEVAEIESTASSSSDIVVWPLSGEEITPHSVDALVYNATMSDWRTHSGMDIAAPLGTQVIAASDGTVADIYEDDFLGTTVVIYHANSLTSKYSNLSSVPTVAIGDMVKAGDVIGAVGETAMSESAELPHLHLEVLKEGVAIDPVEWLDAK